MLEVKKLTCGYEKIILEDISFHGEKGDILCLLGANGSGKSTLIKTILGLIDKKSGQVYVNKEDIEGWSWREKAKKLAYIGQSSLSNFPYRAIDIVLMGRTAYLGFGFSPRKEDLRIAEEAMERLKIGKLRDRIYSSLSGGERQLVKIAQALAQEADILLMDEPTSNLDFGNQINILKHLEELTRMGKLVIMATHFPDQALAYANKVLLINKGGGKFIINPKENMRGEDLSDIYNLDLKIIDVNINDENKKITLAL